MRQRDASTSGAKAKAPARNDLDDEDPLDMKLEQERQKRRGEARNSQDESDRLPPETVEDLRPYPLNRHFRSQPVLSEAFREEIWRRVTREGQDIHLISSGMGVSVERVAAVVRLKELEKRWEREVSQPAGHFFVHLMSLFQNID